MTPTTIPAALKALQAATCPEDVFGDDVLGAYREWAKLVHEDKASARQKPAAHEAFILLTRLHDQAKDKVKRGVYGDRKPFVLATLTTKTVSYSLSALLARGDLADLYRGVSSKGVDVVVKIGRDPRNNDLLKAEADLLAKLPATMEAKHATYFPNLLDSFETGKARARANVFSFTPNAISLTEVRAAFPHGIYAADAAWMWNRALEALHLLHEAGYVHGAVTPDRFLIVPQTHQGILIDFCYAAKIGGTVKAISPAWRASYAPEIPAKKPVDPSTDVYMAAGLLDYLVVDAPAPVKSLLKACRLGRAHRIKTAREVHADFAKVLRRLYGPKRFRPFNLPTAATAA